MKNCCSEETCLEPQTRSLHIKIDGKDIPIGRFVQGFLSNTIIGMLTSLKKSDVKDGSLIEITMRYKE